MPCGDGCLKLFTVRDFSLEPINDKSLGVPYLSTLKFYENFTDVILK